MGVSANANPLRRKGKTAGELMGNGGGREGGKAGSKRGGLKGQGQGQGGDEDDGDIWSRKATWRGGKLLSGASSRSSTPSSSTSSSSSSSSSPSSSLSSTSKPDKLQGPLSQGDLYFEAVEAYLLDVLADVLQVVASLHNSFSSPRDIITLD